MYQRYEYDESERLATSALETLLQLEKVPDLGVELDSNSVRYTIVYQIAHAYNRLNVIAMSRYDFIAALEFAATGIVYAEPIRYYIRVSLLYSNIAGIYSKIGEDVLEFSTALKLLLSAKNKRTWNHCKCSF